MLWPYLNIWDWDWLFGRAVKAISSPGVRSPCLDAYVNPCADKKTQLNHHFLETCLVFKYRYYLVMKPLIKNKYPLVLWVCPWTTSSGSWCVSFWPLKKIYLANKIKTTCSTLHDFIRNSGQIFFVEKNKVLNLIKESLICIWIIKENNYQSWTLYLAWYIT